MNKWNKSTLVLNKYDLSDIYIELLKIIASMQGENSGRLEDIEEYCKGFLQNINIKLALDDMLYMHMIEYGMWYYYDNGRFFYIKNRFILTEYGAAILYKFRYLE